MDINDLLGQPLFPDDLPPLEGDILPSQPVKYARRRQKIEYISGLKQQALTELIEELPPEDTDLWIVGNGSGKTYEQDGEIVCFEFGHFVPVLVKMLTPPIELLVSTWTMNRYHAGNLLSLLDGTVSRLVVLTDQYFKRREAAVANYLIEGIQRVGLPHRFFAFKNHVKVLALKDRVGGCVVVSGSANLSAQPRSENYVLSTDKGLFEFFKKGFFDAILEKGGKR